MNDDAKVAEGIQPLTESARRAAKRLGVSVNTMLRLGREGKVRMLDLGPKCKRFPIADTKRLAGVE
jgi:predicted site-specific integrase-resolvase